MPIPVLLLTGYLGAGKTTLLNRLLASPAVRDCRPALIINEFGPLGVDGHLVPPDARRYEINQGSLFCTCTRAQFLQALNDILCSGRTGMVLIESTGIAETRNLEGEMAVPDFTRSFRILANLCVIDAASFTKVAPFLRMVQEQVRWADGLVINKVDCVSEAEVRQVAEVVAGLNPDAPQVRAVRGAVPESFWQGLKHAARRARPIEAPPAGVVAAAIRSAAPISRARFADFLRAHEARILRLKGNVLYDDGSRRFVELAGGRLTEGAPIESLREATALTVIGWRIEREALEAALNGLLSADVRG